MATKKTKKVPMRLCLGCQTLKPKRELLRILKDTDGTMILDPTGKLAGHGPGAYLCKNETCFAAAKKGHRIERKFACRVSEETYEEIYHALQGILESESQTADPESAVHLSKSGETGTGTRTDTQSTSG